MDPLPWVDLPGPPWELVDCSACGGRGATLSLHPLYGGAEFCLDCYGGGEIIVESKGDPK
jgi:DnaJ-class molecular chaperone